MKNALIYASNFIGHRQIYVFVISHILHKLDYKVHIAGNFSEILKNSFYLDKLKSDENILKIDTSEFEGFGLGISNEAFIEMQARYNIELTIFAEADNHIPLFNSQITFGKRRLNGKIIGIFLRPYYYNKKFSFIDKIRYIRQINQIWKSDMRLFYEVLNPGFRLLDVSLHIDDFFVSKHKKTVWLPDVFQQYADKLVSEEKSDQRIWIKKLDEFKNSNKGSFFLLYFGTPQQRRGYEQLLKLAVDYKACFIHCGVKSLNETLNNNTNELRMTLKKDNKLFETDEYFTDPVCIEYFFTSVSHLILPYIDFYGSSGVMLQALSYGIPVLVPDIGIMAYRVKKYNLGHIFHNGEFEQQFLTFINTPKETFSSSIESYMKLHSNDELQNVLIKAFKN